VVLGRLEPDRERQRELFENNVGIEKLEAASATIDAVNEAYGKHKFSSGTGLFLGQHRTTERDIQPWRKTNLLVGETERQHLKIPRWCITV
jgi:hypothetical protein